MIISILRPILFRFIQSSQVKDLIIEMLRKLAKATDNTIDDLAVDMIERGLKG
jgi:hypothetical protein